VSGGGLVWLLYGLSGFAVLLAIFAVPFGLSMRRISGRAVAGQGRAREIAEASLANQERMIALLEEIARNSRREG